ncbi:uncharacterized protein METZ01_LOCUS298203, partial [marine metagenome]
VYYKVLASRRGNRIDEPAKEAVAIEIID